MHPNEPILDRELFASIVGGFRVLKNSFSLAVFKRQPTLCRILFHVLKSRKRFIVFRLEADQRYANSDRVRVALENG